MSMPPRVFAQVFEFWNKALDNKINCKDDEMFCTVDQSCEAAASKLKPVGLNMSGTIFELKPMQYLFQADGGKCYFILSEGKLGGKNKDIYIMGDAFLKHFYSAFDMESN